MKKSTTLTAAAARAKVAAIENALKRSPGNQGLRITLLSAKRMADRAADLCQAEGKRAKNAFSTKKI